MKSTNALWEFQNRKNGTENMFKEVMAERIPNLEKEMDIQTHETQRTLNRT